MLESICLSLSHLLLGLDPRSCLLDNTKYSWETGTSLSTSGLSQIFNPNPLQLFSPLNGCREGGRVKRTMLEWTVACSMYLAMPVTNAFRSSKLVLKLGCRRKENVNTEHDSGTDVRQLTVVSYRTETGRWHVCEFILKGIRDGSTDLIHDRGGQRLDAWLLVRERKLLQQVHVGQSVL